MENLRVDNRMLVVVSFVMMGWVVALSPLGVMGNLHKVGGSKGWHPDVNYTQWSAQEQVIVGDWLLFKFDKRYYNVLEVNKTSYENCIDRDFIKNVTLGGRNVVQLTEARTYYYLSSGGYCFHQMRVAVNVSQGGVKTFMAEAEAPGPSSQDSAAGSLMHSVCASCCTWIVIFLAIIWFV